MAGQITVDSIKASSGVLATQNGMTGIAKAWVTFTGSTATVNGSFNVSSITRASAGNYTVNFTTAMANANYSSVISCGDGSQVNNININYNSSGTLTAPTTSAFIFSTVLIGTGARDQTYINVAVLGA